MNRHHSTLLATLWPSRDDREAPEGIRAPARRRAWKDGFVTALGEAQGRLDTLTARERLALCWAILWGRS